MQQYSKANAQIMPQSFRLTARLLAGAASLGVLAAPAATTVPSANAAEPRSPQAGQLAQATQSTIADLVSEQAQFSTLARALEAADLAQTLSGEGPYTVFAPTNQAFEQLPDGALEQLLKPENRAMLQQLLEHHVVSGELPASELEPGRVEALLGELAVEVADDGSVTVGRANVVQPDVQASNGIVHAVDRLLLPAGAEQALSQTSKSGDGETETAQVPSQTTDSMEGEMADQGKMAADRPTPFALVQLAQQGFFREQGVPAHGNLRTQVRSGRFGTRGLIRAAIEAGRLTPDVASDRSYLKSVRDLLQSAGGYD